MPNYKIADLIVALNDFNDQKLTEDFESYLVDEQSIDAADVKVNIDYFNNNKADGLPPIPDEGIIAKQSVSVYTNTDDGLCVSVCDFNINAVIAQIKYNKSFNSVNVMLAKLNDFLDNEPVCFAKNIMDIMFQILIQNYDGFVFHASTIMHKGVGIAFSADSGTGKSTHTALWQKLYGDTVVINDDAPIIRIIDGKPYVYGAPWAGTTGINTNVKAPLRAIVFLERGETNAICELSTLNSLKRFFGQIRNPVTIEQMTKVMLALDSVITKGGAYLLKCNMEDDAAITVENYLFNN